MYHTEQFEKDLLEWDIVLTDRQQEQFLLYYEMLLEWNQVMNLTAITEYEEVMKKHFTDSLSLVKAMELTGSLTLIDVGSGAGFPAVPLKIVFPNLKVTLLDSLNKRIRFLQALTEKLGLTGIEALHGRAEDLAKQKNMREQFDVCVSRAVANMTVLSEYCLPFVKVGGKFAAYKSEKSEEEIAEAEDAIERLGGKVERQVKMYLPHSDIFRNIFIIGKVRETPKEFPRKAGTAAKEPLCKNIGRNR